MSHDGFTLLDLLSHNERHNHANGEHNRDGHRRNLSFNCGVEGPTDDPAVQALRGRLQRALLASTLLAQGTPMLAAGDELGHRQRGNNNPYCQDNELTWIDWLAADADLIEFTARLIGAASAPAAVCQPLVQRQARSARSDRCRLAAVRRQSPERRSLAQRRPAPAGLPVRARRAVARLRC